MVKMIVSGSQIIEETTRLDYLVIEDGGSLKAPDGKFVQLSENGIGREQKPGVYQGEVILTVAELFRMPPHGLMIKQNRYDDFRCAVVIKDNQIMEAYGVPAVVRDGDVTGRKACGIRITSDEESFNGILVTGDSEYVISRTRMHLDGKGINDFCGVGAGVTVIDNAHVTIEDSVISLHGETRCAIHVGGDSVVHVKRCLLENFSPGNDAWMGKFSWGFAAMGTNRVTQLCDNGTVFYSDSDIRGNGWGIFSIDGCDDAVSVYVKNCNVSLDGPGSHGYGGFCIGDRNVVSFDHSKIHVSGYAALVRGMLGLAKAEIINGCDVDSRHFGVLCFGDAGTSVFISDSRIRSTSSTLAAKGSSTKFYLKNADLRPANQVLLQLMDNDECGMETDATVLPVGRKDFYLEGRNLSVYDPEKDVSIEMRDMTVSGDIYNSTTALRYDKDAVKSKVSFAVSFCDGVLNTPPKPQDERPDEEEKPMYDDALRGPKNLLVEMKGARLEGIISSAMETHREGITRITPENRMDMSNVIQKAAPTVNNGVIVRMDAHSTWLVKGTSYLTGIEFERGAILKGYGNGCLRMTVDGKETAVQPGAYTGKIVLSVTERMAGFCK